MATFQDYLNILTQNIPLVPQVIKNVVTTGQIAPVGATPASTYVQKTATPTTTFGQLNNAPAGSTNRGVVVADAGTPKVNTQNIIGGPYDINPATGKQYAWNPKTGKFDMNYYNELIGLVSNTTKLSADEQQMLKQLSPSNINYSDLEKKALDELTPYYNKLLDTYNGDVDMAKAHMEETYQLGLRQTRETHEATQKDYFQNVFRNENEQQIGNLSKGGMLNTPTGRAAGLATTLSTGEKLGGESQMGYAGLAGKRMALLAGTQQARNEAIQRAIKQKEEETGLAIQQKGEETARAKEQKKQELEQQKRVEATQLGASRYQRALTQNQLKINELLGA